MRIYLKNWRIHGFTRINKMTSNFYIIMMIISLISHLSQRTYLHERLHLLFEMKQNVSRKIYDVLLIWSFSLFISSCTFVSIVFLYIFLHSIWSIFFFCAYIYVHIWHSDSIIENWVIHPFFMLQNPSVCCA